MAILTAAKARRVVLVVVPIDTIDAVRVIEMTPTDDEVKLITCASVPANARTVVRDRITTKPLAAVSPMPTVFVHVPRVAMVPTKFRAIDREIELVAVVVALNTATTARRRVPDSPSAAVNGRTVPLARDPMNPSAALATVRVRFF
jgi:hypothetical protein